MKKEEVKYYMPVGIFAGLTSAMISEAGTTLGFWVNQETIYPLTQIMPFDIGMNVVLTMWVVKYTFRRFWLYMAVNTVLDIGFNFSEYFGQTDNLYRIKLTGHLGPN
jgi:hypothetical protein